MCVCSPKVFFYRTACQPLQTTGHFCLFGLVCSDSNIATHLLFCMSHYSSRSITNPSANVVTSHPAAHSNSQLRCSGPHHHHLARVTSVAASRCYLSLPSCTEPVEQRVWGIESTQVCHHCGFRHTSANQFVFATIRETLIKVNLSRRHTPEKTAMVIFVE